MPKCVLMKTFRIVSSTGAEIDQAKFDTTMDAIEWANKNPKARVTGWAVEELVEKQWERRHSHNLRD